MRLRYLASLAAGLSGLLLLLGSAFISHPLAAGPLPAVTPTAPSVAAVQPLAAPDLAVESIAFSPPNPDVGAGVDITVTVRNQGDADAPGFFRVHLYIDPSDEPPTTTTLHTLATTYGIPLPPTGTFDWVSTGHTFATSGTHPVYAWVDRDDDVAESDETNNLAGPVYITAGHTHGPDSYEDDDLCEQANPIPADGTEQQHNLYPAPDEDWARFDATGGVTYRVQAIADGADADLLAELHGICGSPPTFGSEAEFEFTAPADGTYFVKVEHVQPTYGPDTAYRLRVTALNLCQGYHEPNDTCATAADVAVDAAPQTHTFCQSGDADWVRFQTTAGSSYVISATNAGANADAQLSLYTLCPASPVISGGQRLEYTALISGVVYVRAENLNPALYGADTDYALQVMQTGHCQADAYEEDDTAATARPLTVDGPAQAHGVCPAGEADWASFQATAGVTYTIETLDLGGEADTVLYLFDAGGTTQLAGDDDSGPGKGSRIVWPAPANSTYTLRVKDYHPAAAGPETRYDLRVFTGRCTPDALEPDDTRYTAQPIATDGRRQAHDTCPAGDVDWVYFSPGPGSYVIETTDLGPEADTFVELYEATGSRLASSDDYGPGTASRILYTFGNGETYYVKVRHYNPTRYGTGTEYSLRVYRGNPPTPTPTPSPPPTVTPTPTPPPSGVRTLILVNRTRVVTLYGETAATQLMGKLDALAAHDQVQGEVIRLDGNATVSAAYAAWLADETSVDGANRVAAAIRGVIVTYRQQHGGVEYVVLVGDDRLLPFRRVADNTPRSDYLEWGYPRVITSHATGAALRANYFLTDDYYADREPTPFQGRELYIPDVAIGRLVETPDEIVAFVDAFLASSEVTADEVLVTGYDFIQDTGSANCADWQADLGATSVDCSLIGSNWTLSQYRARQLNADPPFKVQSINGHANHYREGAPGSDQSIGADEIATAASDLSGGVIYTLGCHSGLNVPPDNPEGALDLAQAFARKKANYVGNTGYGWGLRGAIGLSEKLMRLLTEELRRGSQARVGPALATAKRRYYQEDGDFSAYDEKILEESVLYGLPMYRLNTASTFAGPDDDFPSADVVSSLPGTFGDETVVSGTVGIQLLGTLGPGEIMSREVTADGVYYSLDGHAHVVPGQPVQPLLYADVTAGGWPARGVVLRGGTYSTENDFDPVVVSPVNEYVTRTTEAAFGEPGWYPPLPVGLRSRAGTTNLVTQMGQYGYGQARLYSALQLDLYYSLSTDQTIPQIIVVDGLYNRAEGQVSVKVGATDPAGIRRVLVTYTRGDGRWESVEAGFDAGVHKWVAGFPGDDNVRYFAQVVDGAGNVAQATNKGLYFAPAVDPASTCSAYLPLIMRGAP